MIYLLLLLVAAAILAYVLSRWLRGELRELRAWLHDKTVIGRGGLSQNRALELSRRAFAAEGLSPDLLIVSRQIQSCYERLRRDYMRERASTPLPAAVVLVLGADVDARRLFLRAVAPTNDGSAEDLAEFFDFDAIRAIDTVPARLPAGAAPRTEQALEIVLTGAHHPPYHFGLEPEWGPSPKELAARIENLIGGRWRPDAAPAIVR